MCVALIKKSGVDLPEKSILEMCFKNNPHGAGFCIFRNNRIEIHKGFFTFDGFMNAINKIDPKKDESMLIHFRVATHGKINISNCHPFPITDNFEEMRSSFQIIENGDVMVHNGKLNISIKKKKFSDSMHFAKCINGLDRVKYSNIIEMAIAPTDSNKRGSRIAVLTKNGEVEKYGQGWIEDNGIIYSNDSYKEFSTYKGTTKKSRFTTTYNNTTNNTNSTNSTTNNTNTIRKTATNDCYCSVCNQYTNKIYLVCCPIIGYNNDCFVTKKFCTSCYNKYKANKCDTCNRHFYSEYLHLNKKNDVTCHFCHKKAQKKAQKNALAIEK